MTIQINNTVTKTFFVDFQQAISNKVHAALHLSEYVLTSFYKHVKCVTSYMMVSKWWCKCVFLLTYSKIYLKHMNLTSKEKHQLVKEPLCSVLPPKVASFFFCLSGFVSQKPPQQLFSSSTLDLDVNSIRRTTTLTHNWPTKRPSAHLCACRTSPARSSLPTLPGALATPRREDAWLNYEWRSSRAEGNGCDNSMAAYLIFR